MRWARMAGKLRGAGVDDGLHDPDCRKAAAPAAASGSTRPASQRSRSARRGSARSPPARSDRHPDEARRNRGSFHGLTTMPRASSASLTGPFGRARSMNRYRRRRRDAQPRPAHPLQRFGHRVALPHRFGHRMDHVGLVTPRRQRGRLRRQVDVEGRAPGPAKLDQRGIRCDAVADLQARQPLAPWKLRSTIQGRSCAARSAASASGKLGRGPRVFVVRLRRAPAAWPAAWRRAAW